MIHYSWSPGWPAFEVLCRHEEGDEKHIIYIENGNIKRALKEMNNCIGKDSFYYTPNFPEFKVITKNHDVIDMLFDLADKAGMIHQPNWGLKESTTGFATNKSQRYCWIRPGVATHFSVLTVDEAVELFTKGYTLEKDFTINAVIKLKGKTAEEVTELVRTALSKFDYKLEIK